MNDISIRMIVRTALFTALIAIGGIFSFPAPWNPMVPFTMATFFVILSGALLGPFYGSSSVLLYLFMGLIGIPVFAGGTGGIQHFAGPTGGFLIGYLFSAFITGVFVTIDKKNLLPLIAGVIAGTLAIYSIGFAWLYRSLHGKVEEWSVAIMWGKYASPFLIGDAIKAIGVVLIAYSFRDRSFKKSYN